MKFNKLRLLGFKSFVEPIEFVIEPGLTGVVGPNGCGKSNLVEAMRWIMGENSYKNMRASAMDDVIFSGSGNRPARNTAEVGLFLDNKDRTAPAAFNDSDEIQVTRRIEREAGSAYRINGKDARAKDVQLLFADASTGARSPSMVGQGRIGELIQAKPQARRQLLEEAAGISGLYSRRHEAELRLRAAETNLERLEDITGQLESQIESLKRQARQANRFKSISADIRKLEARLLHIRWQQSKTALKQAQSELTQASNQVADNASQQAETVKNQAVAAHKLPELRENEAKAMAALQRLQIGKSQIEDEAERLKSRRSELDQRMTQLQSDITREQAMVNDNDEILQRLADEKTEINTHFANSDSHAQELKQSFDIAAKQLDISETVLSELTVERAQANAQKVQVEKNIADLELRMVKIDQQKSQQQLELTQIREKMALLPDPKLKQTELDHAEERLRATSQLVTVAEAHLEECRRKETEKNQLVTAAQSHLNEIETEARTITNILNAAIGSDEFSPIVDVIKVTSGFETALGAALGDDLELPVDPNAPAYWIDTMTHEAGQPLPSNVTALAKHVKAPRALELRLSQIGLVETDEQGKELQNHLKPGQKLVGKNGALWRWDGYVASADAPTASAMRLAQKNRLSELGNQTQAATISVNQAIDKQKVAVTALSNAQQNLKDTKDAMSAASVQVSQCRQALVKAQEASGAYVNQTAVLAEAQNQFAIQMEDIAATLESERQTISNTPDLIEIDKKYEAVTTKVATERSIVSEARVKHEGMERENNARRGRLNAIEMEIKTWQNRGVNAQEQIAALTLRLDTARQETHELDNAPNDLIQRRTQLLNQLEEADRLRKLSADQLIEAETRSKQADKLANEALTNLSLARETLGRAEERQQAAKERQLEAETRIRETLNCQPHEIIKLSELDGDPDSFPDASQIEKSLERMKIERERLGAVNLRAQEEQIELSDKYDKLIADRDDIIDAIRKLRSGIQNLNKEGRERLLEAFDLVNDQFTRLFTHLFGGGTAQLQLVESDDPLEAGLEILARPLGKKPQTMTLLSGGEQALTAMALIFAVFLTNPAPICVLDEVDAPLDDHNVERFCNLMDEMSASTETRFVIITHNPITMARMDRLFGVTMAEQGVSQLVSVDLQGAEQMRDVS